MDNYQLLFNLYTILGPLKFTEQTLSRIIKFYLCVMFIELKKKINQISSNLNMAIFFWQFFELVENVQIISCFYQPDFFFHLNFLLSYGYS